MFLFGNISLPPTIGFLPAYATAVNASEATTRVQVRASFIADYPSVTAGLHCPVLTTNTRASGNRIAPLARFATLIEHRGHKGHKESWSTSTPLWALCPLC